MDLTRSICSIIDERSSIGNDNAFYIFDLEDVRLKYEKWVEQIPRVVPFYAIKSNNAPEIVKLLAKLGTGFDCASVREIEQILQMGVQPNRIIYAHTIKQTSHLQFAADNGVEMVTFDSPAELVKIKRIHPKAKVVLRIKFDAENSTCFLGMKFGCDPISEAPELIEKCKELRMNLIGISFHVGTGTQDYEVYERALRVVRQLFDVAKGFKFKLNFVDIGGGFIGNDVSLIANYAKYINKGIEKYFSDPSVTIISEPGSFFSESAFKLVVQVILKKISKDGHRHYYINDSISQSFVSQHLWKIKMQFKVIRRSQTLSEIVDFPSTIWGQTCNGIDVIIENQMIPQLEIGDHMVFENMGAYTITMASNFNGFKIGDVVEINKS